jgi:hypothetical protein
LPAPRFYKPALTPASAFLIVPLIAALASSALGTVYAAIHYFAPNPLLTIIAVFFYAGASGWAGGGAARLARLRSPNAAMVLTAAGCWAGFYAYWVAWAALQELAPTPDAGGLTLMADLLASPGRWVPLALDPPGLLALADSLDGRGNMSLWSSPWATGPVLKVAWVAEFLFFTAVEALKAWGTARDPYSPEAKAYLKEDPWTGKGFKLPRYPSDRDAVLHDLGAGDLRWLSRAGIVRHPEADLYTIIRSHPASPGGTVDVRLLEHADGRKMYSSVVKGVIADITLIRSLEARLERGE